MFGSPSLVWRPVGLVGTTIIISSGILLASAAAYTRGLNREEALISSASQQSFVQPPVTQASLNPPLPVPTLIRPTTEQTKTALSLVPLPRKPSGAEPKILAEITQSNDPQDIGDLLNLLDGNVGPETKIPEPENTAEVVPAKIENNEPSLSEFLTALALDDIEVETSSNPDQATQTAAPDPEPNTNATEDKPKQPLPNLQDLGLSKPKAATQKIQRVFDLGIQVSNHAGAGDKFWNGRFPWTATTPIVAKDGEPVSNPIGTQAKKVVKRADSNVNDGSIPQSFILSAVSDLETEPNSIDPLPQPQPTPAIDQETLVANYGGEISKLIQQNIEYPKSLLPEKTTGTVELGLVFNTLGKITNVVIIKSSDNRIIDEGAVATVRGIKFPVPPDGATPEQLRFGIKMTYTPPATAS